MTNQYSALSEADKKDLMDNYLIEHFSISAVQDFISNEKAFEKKYIFKIYDQTMGLSQIIGSAYHKALEEFFTAYKEEGMQTGFDSLVMIGHEYIESIPATHWRPQVKKSIEEMKAEAIKRINFLIKNFLAEVDSYLDDIQEILFVEKSFTEFITLDGIDLPVPFKFKMDIGYIDKDGFLCVTDHKAKKKYTEEEDVNMDCANQSIGYAVGLKAVFEREFADLVKKYPKIKEGVKRFTYYENKYSENQDGSSQIKRISIDIGESSQMYEAMLFDGVWRVLRAVQDPDYVYLMNRNDYFQDKGEMVDFWVKTRVEGLDGFPQLSPKQKRIMGRRRKDLRTSSISKIPKAAIIAFKEQTKFVSYNTEDMSALSTEEKIVHRLKTFGYMVNVAHVIKGYSCDTYLLEIGAGMQSKKIYNYRMDIAQAVGKADVRIAKGLLTYDGCPYVAIEVNNDQDTRRFLAIGKDGLGGDLLPIGKDNFDHSVSWDPSNPSTPHMLVAGASGSGKSIALKTMIEAAITQGYEVTIIDPKRDEHFKAFSGRATIYHEMEDIELFLEIKVDEMDAIYKSGTKTKQIIFFDEASDCFTRQSTKKRGDDKFRTLQQNTLLLAQKARSAGIHLVLASQRFSVKVLSGDAKANFPARLCLTVTSGVDAKVMLDDIGAEALNGKGDALYRTPELSEPVRIQTYILND